MIVNNKQKFVFIHIPKTAGRSMQDALASTHVRPRHAYASDVKNEYKDYFMFAFVRNPWERLLSIHTFATSGGWIKQTNFREWLLHEHWWEAEETRFGQHKTRLSYQTRPMSHWFNDGEGNLIVDFVGRFETLQTDLTHLCKTYDIQELPHLNATKHSTRLEAYDQEMVEFVAHHHKIDIDTFGYEF